MNVFRVFVRFCLALALCALLARAEEPTFQIKDGDVWVMAGDSITAQRLHTNYIEAFFRTRYPQLHLHFRNSGVGGNRVSDLLQRFDYDVAAWHPTIISVELGMNDVFSPLSNYLNGSSQVVQRSHDLGAQPIFFSASPINDGSMMNAWMSTRCQLIHPYSNALAATLQNLGVLFVDQYHPLIDVWGANFQNGPTGIHPDAAAYIPLGGTTVHVGPVAQYTMAAAILQGLHVDGDVSSATITAEGEITDATRCAITDVSTQGGVLSFTRLDEVGPWPILPSCRSAVQLYPSMLDLSRYMLRLTGLAEGDYRVSINGKPAGIVASSTLEAGWNMTTAFDGALGDRSVAILTLIDKLQTPLNTAWRSASKLHDVVRLASAQAAIDACEIQLQALVQPVPLRFSFEKVYIPEAVTGGPRPDAATATGGPVTLYPLANDILPGDSVITEVSDPSIVINGRALVVPTGYTGTFTYTAGNDTISGTASVTITAGTPEPTPRKYSGLLTDSTGAIVGSIQATLTLSGSAVAQMRYGPAPYSGRFTLRPEDTEVAGRSTLGAFTVTRQLDGTLSFNLDAAAGPLTSTLRPTRASAHPQRYQVALASIDDAIPGGGFATVTVTATGLIRVSGHLPDGRAFTGNTLLNDNDSFTFFVVPSGIINRRGVLGGTFTLADLPTTDLTGELSWSKPPQPSGTKGLHLGGLNTILTANGSLYTGSIPLTGPGAVTLSGGDLAAPEIDPVSVLSGIPSNTPTGSILAWASVNRAAGTFFVRVRLPGAVTTVIGQGVYLPKSRSAWGQFPGTTEGGRIEMVVPLVAQ